MLPASPRRSHGSPLHASQHATLIETSALPMIRPMASDCGDDSPSPSNNSTTSDGATSNARPVPSSTTAVTSKSSFGIANTGKGKDVRLRMRVARVGHPLQISIDFPIDYFEASPWLAFDSRTRSHLCVVPFLWISAWASPCVRLFKPASMMEYLLLPTVHAAR